MRKVIGILAVLIAAASAISQYPGAKRAPADWRKGFESIKESDARSIVGFLAGPSFSGRNALSIDFALAAGACAEMFRSFGMKPAGDNGSYFQKFQMESATTIPDKTFLKSLDGKISFPFGSDFQVAAYATGVTKFRIAFVTATQSQDVSSFDWTKLRNTYVIFKAGASLNPVIRENVVTRRQELGILGNGQARSSLQNAAARAQRVADNPDPRHSAFASFSLTNKVCNLLAERANATSYLATEFKDAAIELSEEIQVDATVTTVLTDQMNVVAKIDGSDALLKSECVLVGAHLDHMGVSPNGIRFGADDNASGCTAALLISRALILNPVKPKRTVIVGLWTMEERGTYGSFAYSGKPHFPIKDTIAYLNLDMVGRNENSGCDIPEFNQRAVYPGIVNLNSEDLSTLLLHANSFVNCDLRPDKEDRTERSDTRNFVFRGIPTVKVFTGEHEDYHQIGDTSDKVNYEKIANVAKWIFITVQELATRPKRPTFARRAFVLPTEIRIAGYATVEKDSLPKDAVIRASVYDADANRTGSKLVASQEYPAKGNRVPFQILVSRENLKTMTKATMIIEIHKKGKVLFATDELIEIPPTGWQRARTIALKKVAN